MITNRDLTERKQRAQELNKSLDFLRVIRQGPVGQWAISYPYGDYNDDTAILLRQSNCMLELTTEVGVVQTLSRPFELARLDTNDLPCLPSAEPCERTKVLRI